MNERLLVVAAATAALVFSILAVALVAVLGYQQSSQVHRIECGQKSSLQSEVKSSENFLKLTLPQRKAKYGSIGDIPDSVIRSSITKEKRALEPLSGLDC